MRNVFHTLGQAVIIIAAILLTGLVLFSCKKDSPDPTPARPHLKSGCSDTYVLWAGQNINAGILTVWNDDVNLYITYQITSPDPSLAMEELHLWAGLDIEDCPQNTPGSPKIGQFPYYANSTTSLPEGNPMTDPLFYSLTVPLASIGATANDIIYIAAHAKAQVETMWSEGDLFVQNGPWSTYSTYTACWGTGGIK